MSGGAVAGSSEPATALRVGIDIGGTKTHAVALAPDGRVRSEIEAASARGPAGVLAGIRSAVHELAAANGVATSELSSVGIGIPGQVDPRTGTVRQAINLDLEEWELAEDVFDDLGIRPAIDNDVNAAAVGARTLLRVPGSMAYLNLGTGVAAGLIVNGALLRGSRGAAGEIGHLSIDPAGPRCECGQRGCIEVFAGGAALARRSGSVLPHPLRQVLDRAGRGDLRAVELRDGFAMGVAAAVRALVLSTDVERVILGGGVTALGDDLATLVRTSLRASVEHSAFLRSLRLEERISVLPRSLNAPAIGAALLPEGAGRSWR